MQYMRILRSYNRGRYSVLLLEFGEIRSNGYAEALVMANGRLAGYASERVPAGSPGWLIMSSARWAARQAIGKARNRQI